MFTKGGNNSHSEIARTKEIVRNPSALAPSDLVKQPYTNLSVDTCR